MESPQLLQLADGRTLEYWDARPAGSDLDLVVFWHHGTPNVGEPPAPLMEASARRGIGWVSHSRPGYGTSTRDEGRDMAAAARDVEALADALGIARFAVMGHSGGGPHALACAALLPEHVCAVVSIAGLAPLEADGMTWDQEDWFAGMYPGGQAELRAALEGAQSLGVRLAEAPWDPQMFTPGDIVALEGEWQWLNRVVELAHEGGPQGMIDDDLASVRRWGFDPVDVTAPTLLIHGARDRVVPPRHGEWLHHRIDGSELWLEPEDSHVSILRLADEALDWLLTTARSTRP
ncbi:MAG: alpha/beta hydrolase [Demequina sp.]